MNIYKGIDNPTDGTLAQYAGVHVIDWQPEWGRPTVAFVENTELEQDFREIYQTLHVAHACATLRDDGTCDGCTVSYALKKAEKWLQ